MPGVIDTLRISYVIDVADKGTKQLLASERKVQQSVVQTSRALAQQDTAVRRSGTVATSTSAKTTAARAREARAAGAAAAQLSTLTRAERAATAEAARAAAATQRNARAHDQLAVSARKAEATQARAARRRPGVVTSAGNAASSARSNVGLAAGVAGAIGLSQTIKFDRALRNVNSIAGMTEKQLQKVGKQLRDMASDTAQAPQTLAEGLYDLVSSGFDAEHSMQILEKSARAATAGLTTTEVSTKAVAAVLNAYRLPASAAGKVSDQLFKTVDRGVISFDALANNVGTVLPVAASLGVGLDQVGAALATMTKQGIGPEESVVRLQGAMTKFIKPSEDMAVALKKIGAESGEQLIREKGLQGAIEAVAGATDGSKAAFARLFPDVRAMQGALALTGNNARSAKDDLKQLGDSGGATQKALAEQSKSTAYQWNQAKANAQALAITVGNNLLPQLNSALQTFSDLPGPVKIALGAMAGAGLVVGPINKLRKNVVELGGSIVNVGRKAAKSRIASSLAEGASGAGTKMRGALSSVRGVIERVMGRAGRAGGATAAESIASSAGANMGPALDRHGKSFRGGRWSKLGKLAGKTFGIAAAIAIGIEVRNALKETDSIGQYSGSKGWGELWRDIKKRGGDLLSGIVASGARKRRGGVIRAMRDGGLVPIMASGGELLVDGGRSTMIPGSSDRDGTLLMARPGAAVLTGDGQTRMAMGASLSEAIRSQAPHFAKGGVVPGKYVATSYGPPWGGIQGTGVTRTGVNLKRAPHVYGIATDPRLIALGSKVFAHPNPFGYTGRFSAFDTGGAIKGRRIDFYDWRGRKRQNAWGRRAVTISRSRIAPRQDGEDVYAAPGGGGEETSVSILGRSRRRSGLLGDAFAQGQAAGQAGLTRGVIKREGNPVLQAITEAIRGVGTQPDRGGTARRAQTGGRDLGRFKEGTRLGAMHAKASAIDAKHYQYAWGGGHGRIGVPTVGGRTPRGGKRGLGYDCSGAVSAVLHAGGLLDTPLTSGALMSWGRKGSGKNLAVYADPRHTIMRIGRRYFGTGEANPQGGAGWLPSNTMKGRGAIRTFPNMRAGGIVGRAKPKSQEFSGAGEGRSRWPQFVDLVHRVWSAQRPIMGARRGLRSVLVGQTPGESSAATWPNLGDIMFSPAVPRAILGKRGDRGYQLNTIVHELAHMGQKRGLSRRESEGGASLFAFRYAPTILGRVGMRPGGMGRDPYQTEMKWVRKHRSDAWVRRGQFGGKFRAGGIVGRLTGGGSAPPSAGRAVTGAVSNAMTLAGGSLEALDNIIGRSLQTRLVALKDQLERRVRKGGPANLVRRLQATIDLIDFELGRRVGRIQDVVEERTRNLDRDRGAVERSMRARAVEPGSLRGVNELRAAQAAETTVRQQNVTSLQAALRTATGAKNRESIREITQQVHDAQDELAESMTRQVELWRDAIRAAGTEAIGASQFVLGLTQTGVAGLEAGQRLAGTSDTPEGMRQRAGAITGGVIPALQASLAAQQFNAQMLAGIGDVEGWRQAIQEAASTTVELATAQADAADLMREAAARAAQDTVTVAASGSTMADLGLQRLELEQRLIGTFESAGGAQGRADFIRRQILPAIQAEIAALEQQRDVAQSQDNADLVRQLDEQIFGRQNDLLQRNLDANEQTAENTEALKEFGGSTAFSYRGQFEVDVIGARVGA